MFVRNAMGEILSTTIEAAKIFGTKISFFFSFLYKLTVIIKFCASLLRDVIILVVNVVI